MYATLEWYGSFITVSNKENFIDIPSSIPTHVPTKNIAKWFHDHYSHDAPSYTIKTIHQTNPDPIKPFHQRTDVTHYGKEEFVISKMTHSPSHRFYSDCCNIDVAAYLKNDSIKEAVVLNGVFFQFSIDASPLGYYKQGEHEVVRELQEAYRPFFRAITICHQGKLDIDSRPIDQVWADRHTYHTIMCGAPLLIDKGVAVIDDHVLANTVHQDIHILECDNPLPGELNSMNLKRPTKTIKSCSNNLPGGIFHAANTNPRSAIATDKEGNVYFIRVMGRRNGILGMDLSRLTKVIQDHIPTVWMAINVDGGAPSQLLHKTDNKVLSTMNQYSDQANSTIKVGNVIAYMKTDSVFKSTASLPSK